MTEPVNTEPRLNDQTQAFLRIVAVMETNIWKRVETYLRAQVPKLMMETAMVSEAARANPWLSGREDDLMSALVEVKKADPNVSFHEGLARAVASLKEAAPDAEK